LKDFCAPSAVAGTIAGAWNSKKPLISKIRERIDDDCLDFKDRMSVDGGA